MFKFHARLRLWLTPPAHLSRTEQRAFVALQVASLFSIPLHGAFIGLFVYWQIPVLALLNVCSILLWVSSLMFARVGRAGSSMVLAITEVILHTLFCVVYVGWGFGIQHYLLVAMMGSMLLPHYRRVITLLVIALGGCYAALYAYTLDYPPLVVAPSTQLTLLHFGNIFGAFGLITLITTCITNNF